MSKGLRAFLAYSIAVLLLSVAYYGYVSWSHPPSMERETLLSEIGEGVGHAGYVLIGQYLHDRQKRSIKSSSRVIVGSICAIGRNSSG